MTVDQFLQNKYVGKKITFYVCELKNEVNEIPRNMGYSPRQDRPYLDWVYIAVNKECVKVKNNEPVFLEVWIRDVSVTEKVIKIEKNKKSDHWIFETLSGYWFRFYSDTVLEIKK